MTQVSTRVEKTSSAFHLECGSASNCHNMYGLEFGSGSHDQVAACTFGVSK